MNNVELLAAVRAWASVNYPGCPVKWIKLRLFRVPATIRLADAPALGNGGQAGETVGLPNESEIRDDLPQAIVDVLDVLRQAKHRMTTTRILEALERGKKYHGRRTVERYLASMVDDGTLNNKPRATPPGYGFPEWDAESETP